MIKLQGRTPKDELDGGFSEKKKASGHTVGADGTTVYTRVKSITHRVDSNSIEVAVHGRFHTDSISSAKVITYSYKAKASRMEIVNDRDCHEGSNVLPAAPVDNPLEKLSNRQLERMV